MYWFINLPFTITFLVLSAVVIAATISAPRFSVTRRFVFWLTTFLSLVVFIPSCYITLKVTDQFRFGEFHYTSFKEVKDWRAEPYLPKEATDIIMLKHYWGFLTKYRIDKDALETWIMTLSHKRKDQLYEDTLSKIDAVNTPEQYEELKKIKRDRFEHYFQNDMWNLPENLIQYKAFQTKSHGMGIWLWYCVDEGMAYEMSSYW